MRNTIKLGDVARIEASIVDPTNPDYSALPHVSGEHITSIVGGLAQLKSAAEDGMESGKYLFTAGDVLYSKLRPYLRKAAVVNFAGLCSADVYPVKADGKRLTPEYLRLILTSEHFTEYANEASARSRMPKLNREQLFAYECELPTVDEQCRIAARLKTQLAAVEEARQAAQAQRKEAEVLTRRIREQSLEALEDAPRVTLGELLLGIETGKSIQTSERLAGEHELGVLKVSAVSWAEFRADEAKAIDGAYTPDTRHFVRQGDLLISRANTVELVGAVVKVERDYPKRLLSDKTLRLVLDERRIHPDYLIQVLRMPEARGHIEGNATGTSDSMRNISQETIRAIPVPLASMDEQVTIATRLDEADGASKMLRQAIQAQLREIELLPARLLAQAFEDH